MYGNKNYLRLIHVSSGNVYNVLFQSMYEIMILIYFFQSFKKPYYFHWFF